MNEIQDYVFTCMYAEQAQIQKKEQDVRKKREGYFAEGVQNMKDQIAQKEKISKVKERKLQVLGRSFFHLHLNLIVLKTGIEEYRCP
jgi:hypothetical protein